MLAVREPEIAIHHHVAEVDAAEWNSIVPADEIQSGHAFVRACQDAGVQDARFWHVTVRRGGDLIGVASLSLMDVPLDLLATGVTRRAIRRARRVRPGFMTPSVLLGGLPVSFGRPCLAVRSRKDEPAVVQALAEAMRVAGAESDAGLFCVKEFSDTEARWLDGLARHGYFRAHSLPSFRLPVGWRTLDAYLGSMRAGYRRQMRETLAARTRHGLRVRAVEDFAAHVPAMFALYEQVIDRAPFQLERLNRAFLERLGEYLPDQTKAIVVEQEGRPLAYAVLLRSPGRLTFLLAGIDYERNRECSAYLNLVAEVVAEAIRTGVYELELGQTSNALKTRIGAIACPRHLYFHCPSRLGHVAFRTVANRFFPPTSLPDRHVFRDPDHTRTAAPVAAAIA